MVKLEGGQLYVELPMGERGERGAQGDSRPTFDWRGKVANVNGLPSNLGSAHAGYGFVAESDGHAHVWNGAQWFDVGAITGEKGDPGSAAALEVRNVTTSSAGGEGSASIGGEPGAQFLDLMLPRGERGLPGERGVPGIPGLLSDAADFDKSTPPASGNVPVWSASTQTWRPGQPGRSLVGPWTLGESSFAVAASNITANTKTLATLNLPEQEFAYRPLVFGSVSINSGDGARRVDMEVRVGSASGALVGKGLGVQSATAFTNQIAPGYSNPITPGSGEGTVPAGVPTTLHVVAARTVGTGAWAHGQAGATLTCWLQPVEG
ncbi:hypothetical protein CH289_07620 [Rhodococcus sp. RS1C4]|nr:hypothetical protein CH289_07620 [Rhodococcus sp. RS1C4]